jgi:hypothetical protein
LAKQKLSNKKIQYENKERTARLYIEYPNNLIQREAMIIKPTLNGFWVILCVGSEK